MVASSETQRPDDRWWLSCDERKKFVRQADCMAAPRGGAHDVEHARSGRRGRSGWRQEARGKVPGSRFVCLFSTIICPSAFRKGSSIAAARAVIRFQWAASHHRLPTRHATGRHGLRTQLIEPPLPPSASGLLALVDAMPHPDMIPKAMIKEQ
jgi:hypothetical protein